MFSNIVSFNWMMVILSLVEHHSNDSVLACGFGSFELLKVILMKDIVFEQFLIIEEHIVLLIISVIRQIMALSLKFFDVITVFFIFIKLRKELMALKFPSFQLIIERIRTFLPQINNCLRPNFMR